MLTNKCPVTNLGFIFVPYRNFLRIDWYQTGFQSYQKMANCEEEKIPVEIMGHYIYFSHIQVSFVSKKHYTCCVVFVKKNTYLLCMYLQIAM